MRGLLDERNAHACLGSGESSCLCRLSDIRADNRIQMGTRKRDDAGRLLCRA